VSDVKSEKEENKEWSKVKGFGSLQNLIPILKTTMLLLEEEKKRTLNKIEELKKLRDKNKHG
jgi:hypothetical protein